MYTFFQFPKKVVGYIPKKEMHVLYSYVLVFKYFISIAFIYISISFSLVYHSINTHYPYVYLFYLNHL